MTAIETPLGAESQSLAPFLFSCEEIAEYEIHSPVKLQKALRLVCSRLNKGDGISATYKDSLRRTYQQLNLILNVQFAQHRPGAVPPWLRDHPRITYTNQMRGYESDFSNDSQVIDLHFFHCMGHRICAHKDGHSALGTRHSELMNSISKRLIDLPDMEEPKLKRLPVSIWPILPE
ncbi:hypothetical protein J7481_14815 [Labrenzia sp. R4_2]|uniref:hypothetical protein n=1 Tax=Labrenzia sp. R4_2 TaxID=2821107 RepID=UPI001AD98CB2|nr:hypothetical protein [Labrenzia sp. R4_2]MBO9420774.1 hypothetical protein [Labrenzia sp. R4_2]